MSEPLSSTGIAARVGLDGAAWSADAAQPGGQGALRAQTDTAIARGVFGVPTMRSADELFWGSDDFPQLELRLAGSDPLEAAAWKKWTVAPRASAVRRGPRGDDG